MSARVLVTGANGRTGRAVLAALARLGAAAGVQPLPRIRAFIRDAAQAPALAALGAGEHAVGDMADPASIAAALDGCDMLVHIGPPMHPDELTMTQHFLRAAAAQKLAHLVYYSVMHPLRRDVRHHRLKLETEVRVIESGLTYTIVQPTRYMQHVENIWNAVTDQGLHAMPFNTQALPLEVMAERARAAGVSADRIEQMRVMNDHYDRYGFRGNPNVLAMLLGRAPTRYRDYLRQLIATLGGSAKT